MNVTKVRLVKSNGAFFEAELDEFLFEHMRNKKTFEQFVKDELTPYFMALEQLEKDGKL